MKKSIFIIMALASVLVACQKENPVGINQETTEETTVVPEAMLYNEVALLIGETQNGQAAFDLARMIKEADNEFETLSIDDISNTETKSVENIDFMRDLLDNLHRNAEKYPAILKQLGSTKANIQELDDLKKLDVELYMPESDRFTLEHIQDITITYDPLIREDYSDGYKYNLTTGEKEFINRVDETYMEENPTIIVLPKDNTVYTKSVKTAEISNGLIKQNITNSALIREQDILYTTVQSIRVNKSAKGWCGAISNKLKLAIYRASGDVEFLDNGELKASGRCHKPILIAISKKDLKASKWKDNVNYLFDDDWDLHEYNQKIYFASEHNMGGSAQKINTDVGIGYKDKKFTADLGFNVNLSFSLSRNSILREHNELTRKSILATNVHQPNPHNGFTVRSYGPVDIVYNFYYTKID